MSAAADDPATVSFSVTGPEPFLDEAEHELVGKTNPVVWQAIRVSHGALRSYGGRHGYDVDPIIDSLQAPDVSRTTDTLTVTWGWEHVAAPFFNYGSDPHTIEGNPYLSFVWEDPPSGAADRWPAEGDGVRVVIDSVDHPGLPESRYIQAGLEWLRQEVS